MEIRKQINSLFLYILSATPDACSIRKNDFICA